MLRVLWAPWRLEYVRSPHKYKGCFLCDYPKMGRDEEYFILKRGNYCYIIMNAYPYNNGHLMIAPYRHVVYPFELSRDELLELNELVNLSIKALKKAFNPDGFNIGVNIGKAAGAGAEHLHVHVVPRWSGDTNFMPVLAEVKVIPQHLKQTYLELRDAMGSLDSNG